MRSISAIALVLSLAAAATLVAQTNPMRPGNWRTTVQMSMPGMPAGMPPQTTTRCVTPQQVQQNAWLSGPDRNCTVSDTKFEGNKVSWKMACTGQMAATGTGELTFMGDDYTGAIKMAMAQGEMTMNMKGTRVGDCPAQ